MKGKGGRWSVWKVWLHPRMALDAIDDADIKKADLGRRLKEAHGLLEERDKECAHLAAENAEVCRRCLKSESELAKMQRLLEEARKELAAGQESEEEKLMAMSRVVSGFEKVKRDYEKRISILEARLRDAEIKYSRSEDNELIDRIDMRQPDAMRPAVADCAAARQPSVKAAGSGGRHFQSSRGLDIENPDDWLLPLPLDY